MASFWDPVRVDGQEMRVYVSVPDGKGPFPAIVVIQHQGTNDELVDGPWRDFGDGLHVEPGRPQGANDTEVTALVGKENHVARVTQSRAASG